MAATLFTIGYEKRSLDEVIALLRGAGADAVLDVRDVAWSHKPGFAKGALAKGLADAGLAYVHAPFAGNPKRIRAAASGVADALDRYVAHLDAAPDIERRLGELIASMLAAGHQPALLCFERDPAQCHRGVLAARWRESAPGRTVRHLGAGAPVQGPSS